MEMIKKIAGALVLAGALDAAVSVLFKYDVIGKLTASSATLSTAVWALVGASAVYTAYEMYK